MSVGVGDPAPAFTLPGTGGRSYALGDYAGQVVVVVFYPGDNSPVCTLQLRSYNHDIALFDDVDAQVLAISPQSVASHEQFSAANGTFAFPLLADEDKSVGERYGVVGPLGFYRRSAFVVDGAGVLRYAHRGTAGLTYKGTDELVAAVRSAR